MDLYELGGVSWWESQCYYHALACLGREGLIICYPTAPYVCLGLHDDLEQEIDQEYLRKRGIPLLRRETGGGVVYLDSNQLFFQLVLRRDNPLLPLRRQRFYEKFLKPAISVYRSCGLPAELKEPADIVVNGRKCSGNAAGDIGECVAYVGNILLDFDFAAMSRVLRVPGAAYRQRLQAVMRKHMTTLADWLESVPRIEELAAALVREFEGELGGLTLRLPDAGLKEMAEELRKRLTDQAWLNLPGRRQAERRVKIAEGVYLLERRLGQRGSLLLVVKDGKVAEIDVSGEYAGGKEALQGYLGRDWHEDLLSLPAEV